MTLQELESIAAGLAPVMMKTVSAATAPLLQRIADLELRPDAEAVRQMIDDAVAKAAAPQFDVEALTARWDEKYTVLETGHARIAEIADALSAAPSVDFDALAIEIEAKSAAAADTAIKAALEALPLPQDGKPGADAPEATPEQIEAAVARYFDANPVPVPADGKDVDPEVIRSLVAEAVAALPAVENGKDAEPDVIRAMVEEAVAALPAAEPSKDADPEVIRSLVVEAVQRHLEANPPKAGEPGKDGVGLAGAVIGKDGALVVTLTNGEMRELGLVVGRDGLDAKGEPGRDGLQLTDFDTELSEDGRILTLSLENDETRVTHELQLPTMIYRGVFKDGSTYVQGDTVTFGGSLWHCNAETSEKPVGGGDAWQLAARKGRDGKDAKP